MNRAVKAFSALLATAFFSLSCGVSAAPITVTTPPPTAPVAPAAQAAPVLDINSATADQLATLPGIGPARSAAIVTGRPYARKDELVKRKIIPASVYTKIRTQIIAKQS